MSIVGPNNFNNLSNILPNDIHVDGSNGMQASLNMNSNKIINVSNPTNNQDAVTKQYCDTNSLLVENNCLLIDGSNSMIGELDMNNNKMINLSDPVNNQDVVTKNYLINYHDSTKLNKSGDIMSGILDMNNNKIINLSDPINNQDVATKNYIDTKYNGQNIFIGNSSGSLNTTGLGNCTLGYRSMIANTLGTDNIAIGSFSLLSNVSGNNNISIGKNTLTSNTNGTNNIAICSSALNANTTGLNNFAAGFGVLSANTTGTNNVAIGINSLLKNIIGTFNVGIGINTLSNLLSGSTNIAIGNNSSGTGSGSAFTSSETNNICIGAFGNTGDNNTIAIGNSSHSKCFIRGIYNITTGGGIPVFINSSNQLGTISSSRRFKENIINAKNYNISNLRVVNFNYKEFPDKQEIGLIAEEVEEIYPELIAYDENNLPYTVKYMDLIPILLQKIQQLEKIIYNNNV